jgi:hypothetical protein
VVVFKRRTDKTNESIFPFGYDLIQILIVDTFLKRQTNLKSMFSALSVKLCQNEEILDGTPKRK